MEPEFSEKKSIAWAFVLCFVLFLMIVACSCTQNTRVHTWGGKMSIDLPAGRKLENITWKKDGEGSSANVWLLTTERGTNEPPKTHYFTEKSAWGNFEGEITIVEH